MLYHLYSFMYLHILVVHKNLLCMTRDKNHVTQVREKKYNRKRPIGYAIIDVSTQAS